MLKRIFKNKGDVSLQTALIIAIVLPLFLLFNLGAYSFFSVQATNYNLNFDVGRYVSVSGCSYSRLQNMGSNGQFGNYSITVNTYSDGALGDSNHLISSQSVGTGSGGNITINCVENSQQGNTIQVITQKKVPVFGGMFPSTALKGGLYTQEAKGD